MTTENKQTSSPNAHAGVGERCTDCGATLVEDQRYCLQCGARRGRPRLDFTAYWKPAPLGNPRANGSTMSPTGIHASESGTSPDGSARGSWPGAPSRRVGGMLCAAVLAAGILAGAALGPTPPNSPADAST
ncbi:MAG: hypothetical protein WB998_02370, partial [Solirubrobacteraceae bacterium]